MHADPLVSDWEGIGQSLLACFGSPCRVRLILSARLCRCLVVPWVSSLFTGRAIRDYVAESFAGSHGVTDATHRIEVHWPRYGQPILAAAYPRPLVEAVQSGLAATGSAVDSIVVSVGPILRRHGADPRDASSLLAFAEDDGITGITVDGGQVTQVETLSGRGLGLEDAALWLTRKRFGFAEDAAMRWLATDAAPEGFAGSVLPVGGTDAPASPGHAVLAACL